MVFDVLVVLKRFVVVSRCIWLLQSYFTCFSLDFVFSGGACVCSGRVCVSLGICECFCAAFVVLALPGCFLVFFVVSGMALVVPGLFGTVCSFSKHLDRFSMCLCTVWC